MIPELTNHLWQSTMFALLAGLIALMLRKNSARVRYGVWLIASLKFFLPFSLLMNVGSRLKWEPATDSLAAQIATPTVSETMLQITQPFSGVVPSMPVTTLTQPGLPPEVASDLVPLALFSIWACGFGAITLARLQTWRRIRSALRASSPLEIPIIDTGLQARSCPGLLEPAVVGLFRPMLLLPAGILNRLTTDQLKAVLAHELCHICRRDNLTAAMHMTVEAAFWFHPLVWWIGARLVEERERACDEEVLRCGNEPQIYAEGILNICKLYRESPLGCISGVTGSNLKRRVEDIMRNRVVYRLSFSRRVLLTLAAVTALSAPIAVGVLHAKRVAAVETRAAQTASLPVKQEVLTGRGRAIPQVALLGQRQGGPRGAPGDVLAGPAVQPAGRGIRGVQAVAAPVGNGPAAWWTDAAWIERLGLTDVQQARIEKSFQTYRQRLTSNKESLENEEAQLSKMFEANPIDRSTVFAQIDKVIQARGEMERTNTTMTVEMRRQLTRVQWTQLQQLQAQQGVTNLALRLNRIQEDQLRGAVTRGRGREAAAQSWPEGAYDPDKTITIEGRVTEFHLRFPRSKVVIEVAGQDGMTTRWTGEWDSPQRSQGDMSRFSLKLGERVAIEGARSRDPSENAIFVRTVRRIQ
jgi:beta-lactamase regulating signal transducer with metallopeptidase domain/Spy/CpxP family protein refolding chaperone